MSEDLETLKWNNWAAQQRFDSQPPEGQKALVKQYHDNVLPYVAQVIGQNPEGLQQQFVMKYPDAARSGGYGAPASPMMQPDPLTVQPVADGYYTSAMSPEEELQYFTTGKMPRAVEASKPDPFRERKRQIDALRSTGGLDGVDQRAVETYLLTGKADAMAPPVDTIAKQRAEREQYLTYIDQNFPGAVTLQQRMKYMITGDLKTLTETKKPSAFDERAEHADRVEELFPGFVTPEMRRAYVLTGDESVFNPGVKYGEMIQRKAYMTEVEAQFPGVFSDEQKAEFLVTGDKKAFAPKKAADIKAANDAEKADHKLMQGLEMSLTNTENTLRAAEKLIEITGGTFDTETGASSYEGRGMFNTPVAGPLSKRLADSGTFTFDANSARAYLKTLKASAVFKTLQDLREASENGSSGLGQVTNVEIDLLGSRIAALDINNLSNEELYNEVRHFAGELVKVRNDIEARIGAEQAARAAGAAGAAGAVPGIEAPSAPEAPSGATEGAGEPITIPQDVWDEIIGGGN